MIIPLVLAVGLSLPPVEQCGGDPAFNQVRAAFADAVRKRDAAKLAAIASDDIRLGEIGEDKGPARLRKLIGGEFGPDYWRELEPLLDGGCSATQDSRTVPSFATRLEGEDMIVAGAREPIRAAPSKKARIIGRASWARVDHNYGDSGPFYWHVRLRSGRTGYIRSERIYSSYSPYALFEQRDGRWRLTMLRLIPAD